MLAWKAASSFIWLALFLMAFPKSILVVGSGGREHALVKSLLASPANPRVICAPGNAGIADEVPCFPDIAADNIDGLVELARSEGIDFVVVGPEVPLSLGLVDALAAESIPAYGPKADGARLEASKIHTKELLNKYRIPTAASATFDNAADANAYIRARPAPIVVKADGLAAGKGVNICESIEDAQKTILDFMDKAVFGASGSKVVIEEFLQGKEASIIAFVDGNTYKTLPVSRDHKRLLNGNRGPNTGGMGVYSPVADITAEDLDFVKKNVFDNVLRGLKAENIDYCGFLYAGIMKGSSGIHVLEFNTRSGDPETQTILPLLKTDLLEIILACTDKKLKDIDIQTAAGAAACVILAGGDYPQSSSKGLEITGLNEVKDALVFHAGTKLENGKFFTNGGRVLSVVGLGADIKAARNKVYAEIKKIHFDGMQYRRDIGE